MCTWWRPGDWYDLPCESYFPLHNEAATIDPDPDRARARQLKERLRARGLSDEVIDRVLEGLILN